MDEYPKININQSSREELTEVPGIGPALAERIISHRPYHSLEDLQKVPGIGANTLIDMSRFLTVDEEEDTNLDMQISSPEEVTLEEEPEIVDTEIYAPDEEIPQDAQEEAEQDEDFDVQEENAYDQLNAEPLDLTETEEQPSAEAVAYLEPPQEPQAEAEKATVSKSSEPIITPPPPREKTAAPQKETAEWVTRSQLIWSVVGTALFTILFTILLTLGVLALLNGGLQFASRQDGYRLSSQITTLNQQSDLLNNEVEGLRTRTRYARNRRGARNHVGKEPRKLANECKRGAGNPENDRRIRQRNTAANYHFAGVCPKGRSISQRLI